MQVPNIDCQTRGRVIVINPSDDPRFHRSKTIKQLPSQLITDPTNPDFFNAHFNEYWRYPYPRSRVTLPFLVKFQTAKFPEILSNYRNLFIRMKQRNLVKISSN